MITRRRSCSMKSELEIVTCPHEFEVADVVEMVEDSSNVNTDSLEMDDLFGIEDLNWSFDRDAISPLFSIGLTDLGDGDGMCQDSGFGGASLSSSPDRKSGDQKSDCQQNLGAMINKNAIAARMNRLKKKQYVSGLETKVGSLSSENHSLKHENLQLSKRVVDLEDETRYLRAVLANESMLGQLLSRLSDVNGMKLSSSLFQGPNKNEHDYALPRKRVKVEEKEASGGVCLHVDKNHVSVEFCKNCAESASASIKM